MAIEKRPWWYDKDEDDGSSAEGDVQGELDVLEDVADDEGDCLRRNG